MNKPFVLGLGVHVLCADGKLREIKLTLKQAVGVLNFITHKQGGVLELGAHTLQMSYETPPVSKGEGGYIPLTRQLIERTSLTFCDCDSCLPSSRN